MPRYYPVFVNLQGKRCLVVGGGEVATRKVQGLLEAEARVVVVSPHLSQSLVDLTALMMLSVVRWSLAPPTSRT